MAIHVACSCGKPNSFPDTMAGQTAPCMFCGEPIALPGSGVPTVPVLHEPVRLAAPAEPPRPAIPSTPEVAAPPHEDDLRLEAAPPPEYVPTVGRLPQPEPGGVIRPFEPVRPEAPGLLATRFAMWLVGGVLLLGVGFGIYWLLGSRNKSAYELLLHDGDQHLEKGDLEDAGVCYIKARTLFPDDPRTADAFLRLEKASSAQPVTQTYVENVGLVATDPKRVQQEILAQLLKQQEAERLKTSGPETAKESAAVSPRRDTLRLRLEADMKRAEANRLAAGASQKAEDEKKLRDEEVRKLQDEELRKRSILVALGQLTTWCDNAVQQVGPVSALAATWAGTKSSDEVVAAIRKLIDDPAAEAVSIPQMPILQRIEEVQDAQGLAEFYKGIPRLILKAEEAERAGRTAKVLSRNPMVYNLRAYERLAQQEVLVKTQNPPDTYRRLQVLANERTKLVEKLTEQANTFLKNLNDCRAGTVAREVLKEVQKLTAARLQALGVAAVTAPVAPPPAPTPANVKVYVLNDGTEIRAVTVASMDDQFVIKDEAGEMHTVSKRDVKEVRK